MAVRSDQPSFGFDMSRQRQPQPDFRNLFFEFFQDARSPIKFKCRPDSNLRHDIAFLSGLIHDAQVCLDEIIIRRKKLTVPLNRDRWEALRDNPGSKIGLQSVNSVLDIRPILKFTFTVCGAPNSISEETYYIDYAEFTANSVGLLQDTAEFAFGAENWRASVILPDVGFSISLRDSC
jgi:hypothetical protein